MQPTLLSDSHTAYLILRICCTREPAAPHTSAAPACLPRHKPAAACTTDPQFTSVPHAFAHNAIRRSKLVPASRVQEIATDGAGFAGFAAWLDMDPTQGDLLAMPAPDSYTPLPWQPEVAWVACDLVHEDAELKHGPRNVLRKAIAHLAEAGYVLKTGVEVEFFVLDASYEPGTGSKLSDPLDLQAKPCYDAHALMRRYELISELLENMEALGWGPYQADHEDANGQFEINWDYADCLTTADRVTFFKYMVGRLACVHTIAIT